MIPKEKYEKIPDPIPPEKCIYFKFSDSAYKGRCNHSDMRRRFWIFSYRKKCILAWIGTKSFRKVLMNTRKKHECELQVVKIEPVTKVTKISKPKPKPKAPHIHKKHIHKPMKK